MSKTKRAPSCCSLLLKTATRGSSLNLQVMSLGTAQTSMQPMLMEILPCILLQLLIRHRLLASFSVLVLVSTPKTTTVSRHYTQPLLPRTCARPKICYCEEPNERFLIDRAVSPKTSWTGLTIPSSVNLSKVPCRHLGTTDVRLDEFH